jgi:hypothetical protein
MAEDLTSLAGLQAVHTRRSRHRGVGNALRATYDLRDNDRGFDALLDELDGKIPQFKQPREQIDLARLTSWCRWLIRLVRPQRLWRGRYRVDPRHDVPQKP